MIVADDDVPNPKPAPDGLLQIMRAYPNSKFMYVGDTVDDARSGHSAGVPFVGIVHRNNPRYSEVVELLKRENAIAILDNVNELESAL
jgi:phosphoglycolate phosphatase-like HAD superfamily hydrolase